MLSFIRKANHPAPYMQSGMIFCVIFCQQVFYRRASEWFYKAPQSRQPLLCFPVRQHCGRCIPLHTQPDFEGINHVQMRYLIVFCCFSYVFTPHLLCPQKRLSNNADIFFQRSLSRISPKVSRRTTICSPFLSSIITAGRGRRL